MYCHLYGTCVVTYMVHVHLFGTCTSIRGSSSVFFFASLPNRSQLLKFSASDNKTCHRDRIARLTEPCPSHKKL